MSSTDIFSKIPDINHQEPLRPVSAEAFDNIVQNRRSVRVYEEEKIPEDVVQQVLDWALLAPNSSNLQPWEFYWVKDPAKKAKLVKALLNQPAARTAQELIVVVAKLKTWKEIRLDMVERLKQDERTPAAAMAYYQKLVPLVYSLGPFEIFGSLKKIFLPLIGLFRPTPRQPTSRADMRVWAVKSAALASQNIMMGFSAHGYDTCPMEGFDSVRVKKILKLGCESEITMVISAGKRSPRGVYGPRIRMSRDKFVKIV